MSTDDPVQLDNELVDALADHQCGRESCCVSAALAAWQREINAKPIGQLIAVDAALAVVAAARRRAGHMDVELPEPSRWARVIGDNGDDCGAPQWVFPGGTITAYSDGVTVGEDFHDDLPALRALTLATLAAIEHAERQAAGRGEREDVTLT